MTLGDEISKIVKEAISKLEKGEDKQKVFEEAKKKLLRAQNESYRKGGTEHSGLYAIKELAKSLGVKMKDEL